VAEIARTEGMTMELLTMPMSERLKRLRKAKGLTQQDLANAAGVSISVVVQIESGKITDPRASTLRGLAEQLGVTLDDLAGDENGGEEEEGKSKKPRRRK
jgi:transcriptional regulator with XRE-family HTH domain